MELGLLLALGCAALAQVALLCEHRGAVRAPDISFRAPLQSAVALFRSRWWAIGFGIASFAWLMHVAALAVAPLSLVQAVIAGGLAMLALPAQLWFGIKLGRRELLGLGLSAAGLAFLALTASHSGDHSSYSSGAMLAFEGGAVALGGALLFSAGSERAARHGGLLLGASAGLMIGVADVAIKALAGPVMASPLALLSPWTPLVIAAGVWAFFGVARSLQVGDPVEVAVVTSVASNVAAIVGGILVFGDPLGSDPAAVAARSAAFVAVIAAAALIPSAAPKHTGPRAQHA